MNKAEYVREESAKGSSGHHCHWPGCDKDVPPAMWGCSAHWYSLPKGLRNRIWATFRPGQEQTKTPSAAYIQVAREVQDWIKNYLATKDSTPTYLCQWPGCSKDVPGTRWACTQHWKFLPFDLRSRMHEMYVAGETGERSTGYNLILDEIRRYIKEREQFAISVAAMKAELEASRTPTVEQPTLFE